MEYQNEQQRDIFNQPVRPLPNATAVLVLGILSIVICFICGIIALVLSSNDRKRYQENPGAYTSGSYDQIRAGRICAIVGICLQVILIIVYGFFVAFVLKNIPRDNY